MATRKARLSNASATSADIPRDRALNNNDQILSLPHFPLTNSQQRPAEPLLSQEALSKVKESNRCLQNAEESEAQRYGYHPETIPSIESSPRRSRHGRSTRSTGLRVPACMLAQKPYLRDLLLLSMVSPPCTTATLRELDLQSIQNNVNLRVDLCFNDDLFFQPVTGAKGRGKQAEAERYWLSLAEEFEIHWHNAQPSCTKCNTRKEEQAIFFTERLPVMFLNLREIVQMLVPETDHEEVANHLDLDLLMQQIRHASLDAVRLTEWLASILTLHCAPIRDGYATEIIKLVRDGTMHFDTTRVVMGIEKLFGLLEAMKLDVANHQIRAFRYPLIEDAIVFQQECFMKAIEGGTIDTRKSSIWFQQASLKHTALCQSSNGSRIPPGLQALIHGMVQVCRPSVKRVPATLQYDYTRFIRLQEDLQDLVQIELCLNVFEQRVFDIVGGRATNNIVSLHEDLKTRLICLTEDEQGNGGAISEHLDAISVELTRAAYAMKLSQQYGPLENHQGRVVNDGDILQTRHALYDAFDAEEEHQVLTVKFLGALEYHTSRCAETFLNLTTLEISNAQRQWNQVRVRARSSKDYVLADWDDMARKLAHIAVINWRVWSDICYLPSTSPLHESYKHHNSVTNASCTIGAESSGTISPQCPSSEGPSTPGSSSPSLDNGELAGIGAGMKQQTLDLEDPDILN